MLPLATKTIGEVTDILIDYRGKTPPKTVSGVKLITAKIIKDGFIVDGNYEYISEATCGNWMRRGLPKQWDILVTTEAPLGEVAQLRAKERVALAQRVILLRGNPQIIDQRYYFYALRSSSVQGELKTRSSGTTVLGIKQSELRRVRIPYHPLPTQGKIAAILSAYDDLIENNLRRIKILEEMAQLVYREWFVKFRFPGHEDVRMVESELGMIPEGWEIKRLDQLCESIKERFLEDKHSNLPLLDLARMLQHTLMVNEMGKPNELSTSRIIFNRGDILFGSIRPYLHKVALAPCQGVTNVSVLVLRPIEEVHGSVLAILLSSIDAIRWADQYSTGTKMPVIKWEILQTMPVVLPNRLVISRYHEIIYPMLQKIMLTWSRNRNLRHTRDLVLPKLISGELDVSGLDIDIGEEPA